MCDNKAQSKMFVGHEQATRESHQQPTYPASSSFTPCCRLFNRSLCNVTEYIRLFSFKLTYTFFECIYSCRVRGSCNLFDISELRFYLLPIVSKLMEKQLCYLRVESVLLFSARTSLKNLLWLALCASFFPMRLRFLCDVKRPVSSNVYEWR